MDDLTLQALGCVPNGHVLLPFMRRHALPNLSALAAFLHLTDAELHRQLKRGRLALPTLIQDGPGSLSH